MHTFFEYRLKMMAPVPIILFLLTSFVSGKDFNCSSMTPLSKEDSLQLKSSNYHHFKIKVKDVGKEEVKLEISSGNSHKTQFSQFFLKARYVEEEGEGRGSKEALGKWITSDKEKELKLLNCGNKSGSGIVGNSEEGFSSVELKWKPPASLDDGAAKEKEVEFVGTFVEGKFYWKDITSEAFSLDTQKEEEEDEEEEEEDQIKSEDSSFTTIQTTSTKKSTSIKELNDDMLRTIFISSRKNSSTTTPATTITTTTTFPTSKTPTTLVTATNMLSVISPKLSSSSSSSSSSVPLSCTTFALIPCIILYIIIN